MFLIGFPLLGHIYDNHTGTNTHVGITSKKISTLNVKTVYIKSYTNISFCQHFAFSRQLDVLCTHIQEN